MAHAGRFTDHLGDEPVKTELIRADHPIALRHAVDVLNHGGLVAFPTDTVYGLAALPFQTETVERLFIAKGRNSDRAIALLIGAIQDLPKVTANFPLRATHLAERFWPGPLTLIVAGSLTLPEMISPNATVGVRMPDHAFALELLRKIGPLAVTSANLSGHENALTAQEVLAQLDGRIHLVLDGGRTPGSLPSTVVDCISTEMAILRAGPISESDIRLALTGAAA